MAMWAAFLRAINVGGRRITSKDLCVPFTDMGFEDVAAFRASGNVVFDAPREAESKLAARIEKELEQSLGYEVVVFLRNDKQMRALAEHRPFGNAEGRLHVMVMGKRPSASLVKKVTPLAGKGDRLAFGERELYWLTPGNMQDAQTDLDAVMKLIGPHTMRTKGTIDQIAKKWFTEEAS